MNRAVFKKLLQRKTLLWTAGGLAAAWLLALPLAAGAWSGVQHIQINKAAGRNVPADMAAFRAFSRPMALPGIFPDLWKESDATEGARHYFEPDRLPAGSDIRALPRDQAEACAQMGLPPDDVGVAPWARVPDLPITGTSRYGACAVRNG